MVFHIHSDESYLSEPQALIRESGFFYLSNASKDQTRAPTNKPTLDKEIHVMSIILRKIMKSAT